MTICYSICRHELAAQCVYPEFDTALCCVLRIILDKRFLVKSIKETIKSTLWYEYVKDGPDSWRVLLVTLMNRGQDLAIIPPEFYKRCVCGGEMRPCIIAARHGINPFEGQTADDEKAMRFLLLTKPFLREEYAALAAVMRPLQNSPLFEGNLYRLILSYHYMINY